MPPELASGIREFFSTTVLTDAIKSFHEPYFADLQKDLAALMASILSLYSPSTTTPRNVLLTLPGMSPNTVDSALGEISSSTSERTQRGWVLKLLESVRGVGVHELGRIETNKSGGKKTARSKMMEAIMMVDEPQGIVRGNSPELGGIAEMFG